MKEVSRSGNKVYVCETTDVLPNIRDLIKSPDHCNVFINSVTINPKDVNASLYSQFSKESYNAFIYAFAVQLGQTRPTNVIHMQIEMNARRVERLCKKRNIKLSKTETNVIDTCKNFHTLKCYYKEQVSMAQELKFKLAESYL